MPKPKPVQPHDRRASDIPHNARITTDEVPDPYDPAAAITVVRSLRDDQLASMYHRKQILLHHFAAGRAWQRLWNVAEIGPPASIDPAVMRVDGSPPRSDRERRRFNAVAILTRIGASIGTSGNTLLHDTLVAGMTLRGIAAARNLDPRPGSSDLIYLGRRLRECLDTVAHELGLA